MLTKLCAPLSLAAVIAMSAAGYGQGSKGDAPKPEADPVRVSGRGDRATKAFDLADGLAVWKVTHNGRSNFKVHLIDARGDEADLWVNEIGRHEGSRAGHVRKAGKYRLQVDADGGWTVTVEQPRPDAAPASPQAFTGKGCRVTAFFMLSEGSHVFEMEHKGKGIFRALLLDARGRLVEQAAGVIGGYDGSRAVKIEEPGLYVMSIVADGEWAVSVD